MNNQEFLKLIHKRSSCRLYLSKDLPDGMINNCLEAARCAPSACNKQPWRFIIVKDETLRQTICEQALLPGIPMPWLRMAPVIAVLCAEKQLVTHKLAPMVSGVKYHLIDIGIAGEHFCLAAESHGLGTCWIGWFKAKPLHKLLNIPKSVEILSLISLGYPAEPIEENQREKLPLNQIAFKDRWQEPLDNY